MWMRPASRGGADRAELGTETWAGPQRLFPCPLGPAAPAALVGAVCARYSFLGRYDRTRALSWDRSPCTCPLKHVPVLRVGPDRLVGKALLDDFRLPLPLHPAFWDAALGRQPADVAGLRRFSATTSIGRVLAVEAALASGRPPAEVAAAPAETVLPYDEETNFNGMSVQDVLEYVVWVRCRSRFRRRASHRSHSL